MHQPVPRSAGRPGAGRPAPAPKCSCRGLARWAVPIGLTALAASAVLGALAATRLAAARDRTHHRRAREVLDERSEEPGYPWP